MTDERQIASDGTLWYGKNGQLHRTDGPAVIEKDAWYLNGKYHRTDGPAVTKPDGSTEWYLHGTPHRVDGPAVDKVYSRLRLWYVNGYMVDAKTKPESELPDSECEPPEETWDDQREEAFINLKQKMGVNTLRHNDRHIVAAAAWHLPVDDDYITAALEQPFVREIMQYRTDVPEHIRTLMEVAG